LIVVHCSLVTNSFSQDARTNHDVPGLQQETPASGRFVQTPAGVMVPYEVTIPGTQTRFTMQPIPGGWFAFEIPELIRIDDENFREADRNVERRLIEVKIEPFWMATHEVTWGEFQHFMDLENQFRQFRQRKIRPVNDENATFAVTAPSAIYDPRWRIDEWGGGENVAAGSMSQYSAKQYSKYISKITGDFYRLPSAAQWQYACLADRRPEDLRRKKNEFNNGIPAFWDKHNAHSKRQEVGNSEPNPWGLYDMQGNVCEWVLDGGPFKAEKWQEMSLTDLEAINWPIERFGRLACGGDLFTETADCLHHSLKVSTAQWWEDDPGFPVSPYWTASESASGVGFRLVRPLQEPDSTASREKFWEADCESLISGLRQSQEHDGRGCRGIVDNELPEAIERLKAKE
jgi:formylglycine-generating enzyme required for sulfatase activity